MVDQGCRRLEGHTVSKIGGNCADFYRNIVDESGKKCTFLIN